LKIIHQVEGDLDVFGIGNRADAARQSVLHHRIPDGGDEVRDALVVAARRVDRFQRPEYETGTRAAGGGEELVPDLELAKCHLSRVLTTQLPGEPPPHDDAARDSSPVPRTDDAPETLASVSTSDGPADVCKTKLLGAVGTLSVNGMLTVAPGR